LTGRRFGFAGELVEGFPFLPSWALRSCASIGAFNAGPGDGGFSIRSGSFRTGATGAILGGGLTETGLVSGTLDRSNSRVPART